jgi:glycosyltransferase involved in cell wall biosynthesis
MRILLVTNAMFPKLNEKLGIKQKISHGWAFAAANELTKTNEVNLAVSILYNTEKVEEYDIDGIKYFTVPFGKSVMKYDSVLERSFKEVKNRFNPDVVHIYGSEYPFTLAYLNACGSDNVVISIQGIPTIYSRYYLSGISVSDRIKNPMLFLQKYLFGKRNDCEAKALKKCKYFEGRSDWDHAISWAFSPNSKYYFCSRTLRPSFYEERWAIENIERHSIFLSQAEYSIKGIHQVIKALPYICSIYPDTKVYVAGNSPYSNSNLKNYMKSLGYGKYIHSLAKKMNMQSRIQFVGKLDEHEMCEFYKRANVFICPSTIENVPNSLAEAQILGTPCIASYVGGNNSLIKEGEDGFLYRFEEYEMLAKYVCNIFESDELALKLSYNGRNVALKRHDRNTNVSNLMNMYHSIIKDNAL